MLKASRAGHGDPLFSFVVVADTHINEQDGVSSSPFPRSRLANDRARHVFQEIAAMEPAPKFVVHLGDIVNPVPSLPTFQDAVARYREITAPVTIPVHLVPGNHDVGDKRVEWMPAGQVCEAYLQTYREAFGRDYFAFQERGIRFIVVNSLLLNSGLPDEATQQAWLEQQVAEAIADGQRVFLFMHYPPYIYSSAERGNYDNIDEPARSWLLSLIRKPGVEAIFAGHVHNFWYDRIGDAEFYTLPSTAFMRHDFTEFYRVAPGVEFGRADVEKFGYFVVDVFPQGHVAYSVRTMGAQAKAGEPPASPQLRHLAHPKTSSFDCVGVELRHPWAESMQITATGGVQEFGRKWARNDYPLLALWEMGVRLSKVTDLDVLEEESRSRMRLLARLGHSHIVTVLGGPKAALLAADTGDCGVAAYEVNTTLDAFLRQRDALRKLRHDTGTGIYFSRIHAFDDSHYDGKHFSHFIKAGFTLDDLEQRQETVAQWREDGYIDGVTVRIETDQPLVPAARRLAAFVRNSGCKVLASLKTSGPSLATEQADDRGMVAKTAQAMILSKASPHIRYVFDTFMDVDRGYFPRHGFIDRRFDLRPAAHAFTTLAALFSQETLLELTDDPAASDGMLCFTAHGQPYLLLCLDAPRALESLAREQAQSIVHDLVTGRRDTASGHAEAFKARLPDQDAQLQVLLIRRA
ncbi:metallophosphoesterase [Cupriavidus sp. TMH.W2]|uniref:metallophosphoesterase n=1 Tax=Cupriavidus sp. TMH.W2 TaxID=3434465 RepID=UPI003D76A47C